VRDLAFRLLLLIPLGCIVSVRNCGLRLLLFHPFWRVTFTRDLRLQRQLQPLLLRPLNRIVFAVIVFPLPVLAGRSLGVGLALTRNVHAMRLVM
jgi:hypothetical protein